jgi:hypothetical protein
MPFNAGGVTGTLDLKVQQFKKSVRAAVRGFRSLGNSSKSASGSVSKFGSGFKGLALRLGGAVAGFFAVKKAIETLKSTLVGASQAQREYEQSVQNLRASLTLAGSKDIAGATAALEEFATAIQRTTSFSDTAVLEVAGLLRTMGVAEDQLQGATKAVLDYSAATGRNATESAKQFGKTLSGLLGELGETFPQLRSLSAEALKSGEAFEKASELMGGFAEVAGQTTEGALTRLSNTLNDLRKRLGDALNRFLGPLAEKLDLAIRGWVDSLGEGSQGFQQLVDTMRVGFELAVRGVQFLIEGFYNTRIAIASTSHLMALWQQRFVNIIASIQGGLADLTASVSGLVAGLAEFLTSVPGISEGIKASVQGVADFFRKTEANARETSRQMDVMREAAAEVVAERGKELRVLEQRLDNIKANVQTEDALLNVVTKIYNAKVQTSTLEEKIRREKEQTLADEQRAARAADEYNQRLKERLKHLHEATGLGRESRQTAAELAAETRDVATAAGAAAQNAGSMADAFGRAASSARDAASAASAAASASGTAGTRAGESRRAGGSYAMDFSDPFRAVAQAQRAQVSLAGTHASAFAGRTQINAARAFADAVGREAQAAVDRAISDFTADVLQELNAAGIFDPTQRSRIVRERITEAERVGVIPTAASLDPMRAGLR